MNNFWIRNFIASILFAVMCFIFTNQVNAQSLSEGVYYLSEFIVSEQFSKLSKTNNDLALVDTVYLRAKQFYKGDISEALLALTFTTLPFNKMPLRLPLIDSKIYLRLPSVSDSLFNQKNKKLPSQIFFDSPQNDFGDKDKVAHFYGNAFLSYNISFFNLSKFMGILVELFETSFKVGGGLDNRDIFTNYLGDMFGKSLKHNNRLLPSQAFKYYMILKGYVKIN